MENIYLQKFTQAIKGKTMVFIDAANLEQSVKSMWVNPKDISDEFKKYIADQLCWRIDYQKLKRFFSTHCKLQQIRFYSAHFESDAHTRFLAFLRSLEFKLRTKPLKEYRDYTPETPHRKANFDVEIAIDTTFALNEYDTFVLFSGDCDFEDLLKFLRGQGKTTVVFSRKGHVAKELPPASSYYFDIVDFRHELLRLQKIPPKRDSAVDSR